MSLRALSVLLLLASATAQAQLRPTHPNLTYATVGGRDLQLDLYRPASLPTPAPLVVWVHGGGWSAGSRFPAHSAAELNARGIAVASISYRLTSQGGQFGDQPVTFPAQIHDVKAALRWLRAHAGEYGLHAGRFGAWGASAGGHLVALLGTSGDAALIEGTLGTTNGHSSRVQAVVNYYGPTDILQMAPDGSSAADSPNSSPSRLLGFTASDEGIGVLRAQAGNSANPFPLYRELARQSNPLVWVDAADPPFLIVHGTADNVVPIGQSRRLRDALLAAGRSVQMIEVAGGGHGGFPAEVQRQAQDFLVTQLTGPQRIGNPAALSGSWYDAARDGQGFTLQWQPDGRLVVFFFGYRDDLSNLNLIGVLPPATPHYGTPLRIDLARFFGGRFTRYDPALVQRTPWGRLDLTIIDCNRINATLVGVDGVQELNLVRLAGVGSLRCD